MKKFTFSLLFMMIAFFVSAASLPVELKINKDIPAPWAYIPNKADYPNPDFYNKFNGLKLDYEGKGLASPEFDAVDSVKVSFTVASLNQNQKTVSSADYQFELIALNSEGLALDTAGVDGIEDTGLYSVKLYGENISKVELRMTRFVSFGGKNYSSELTTMKVEVADGSSTDHGPEVVEVEDLLAFYNFANREKLAKITGAINVVYHYGNSVYVTDNSAALLIYDEKFGEMNTQLVNGDIITGIVGKYEIFEGNVQMSSLKELGDFSKGSLAMPFDASPEELMEGDVFEYVRFTDVELNRDAEFFKDSIATNGHILVGEGEMVIRNHFGEVEGKYAKGTKLTVEGVLSPFAGRLQLYMTKIVSVTTDVDNVEMGEVLVYVREREIVVNSEIGSDISVYSVGGALLKTVESGSTETVIAGMPEGVLMVKVGSEVVKVIL